MTAEQPTVSRRVVLQAGAVAGALGLVAGEAGWSPSASAAAGNLTAQFTRREDQLSLRFEFVNLKLLKAGEPGPGEAGTARLVRIVQVQPAYVIVHFGPQAIGEYAYEETDDLPVPVKPPVAAAVAPETRLAFAVKDGTSFIPYTIQELLSWYKFDQSVVPAALDAPVGHPMPSEPTATQTSIAAPWSLVLSPHDEAVWAHAAQLDAIPPDGRHELWHTRLAVRKQGAIDEVDAAGRTVRAVWTPGFQRDVPPPKAVPPTPPPGVTSMNPRDRWEVVRLSSDWNITKHGGYHVPEPVAVHRLALSPLGAWLESDGTWPKVYDEQLKYGFETVSWTHRAAMGRDTFVRVITRGFLFPTRHSAVWMTTTERKFGVIDDQTSPEHGRPVAYLSRTHRLVPRQRTRTYPDAAGMQPYDGREMPFKEITILTRSTPRLLPPDVDAGNTSTWILRASDQKPYGPDAFWPRVSTGPGTDEDFRFLVRATDAEGNRVRMLMPLIFVALNQSGDETAIGDIIAAYEASPDRVTSALHGQQVALASFPGGQAGECGYPLADITFGADPSDPPDSKPDLFTEPLFHPRMRKARARLDAVERVAGASYGLPTVTLHEAWLNDPDNDARLFARIDPPVDLNFGADSSGGVVTPSMRITGLSARTGPIGGDLSGAQAPPQFDPTSFFAGASPKILGGIPLLDVIDPGGFGGGMGALDTGGQPAPRLVTVPVPGGVETSLTWQPNVREKDPTGVFVRGTNSAITVRARTVVRHDGSPPTTEVSGDITDFQVVAVGSLLELCSVEFRRLGFLSTNGAKPDIDADIAAVRFHGILKFVGKLQEFLGSLGQSQGNALASAATSGTGETNGGFVEVTTAGIRVGYGLTLPPVPLGVFSLENIAIGSSLAIPFDGQPARVRFAFAERDKPFVLTVAIFGGGGFVGVAFGLDRFELFEASLEFGAKFALDIGVASGGVSAVAGIYLAIGANKGELTGYLRLNGELEIIGLIHLAIEFYLGFTYDTGSKEAWGEASVTVEVDVLLFSGSVTLGPVRKRFGGGGASSAAAIKAVPSKRADAVGGRIAAAAGPPSFADLIAPADWDEYRALFAPAAFA